MKFKVVEEFYNEDEPEACSIGNCREYYNALHFVVIGVENTSLFFAISLCNEHYAIFKKEMLKK